MLDLRMRKVPLGTLNLPAGQPSGIKMNLDANINCEKVEDICFFFESTLGCSINIQVVGKDNETPQGDSYDIGDCMNIAEAGIDATGNVKPVKMSVPVNVKSHDVWHPYMGIDVFTQHRNTRAGRVIVYAFIREWVNVNEPGEGQYREQYDPRRSQQPTFSAGQLAGRPY